MLVDKHGHFLSALSTHAAGNERLQVGKLIDKMPLGLSLKKLSRNVLEADKGHDSHSLRQEFLKEYFYILSQLARVKNIQCLLNKHIGHFMLKTGDGLSNVVFPG